MGPVGLADPTASGPLAHALQRYGLTSVLAFDTDRMLLYLCNPLDFAVVIVDCEFPHSSTDPLSLSQLVGRIRTQTTAPVLTLGGRRPERPEEADANLPQRTSPAAVAAAALALATATRQRTSVSRWGRIRIDTATHEAHHGETELQLTAQQFRLLEVLVNAQGTTVGIGQLATVLYASETQHANDQRVRAHVARLRRHLMRASSDGADVLVTVRGLGYRLLPPA